MELVGALGALLEVVGAVVVVQCELTAGVVVGEEELVLVGVQHP